MAEEYCWAITQAAGRSCCRSTKFQCVGVGISSGITCIHIGHIVDHMYNQFRFRNPENEGLQGLISVLCHATVDIDWLAVH